MMLDDVIMLVDLSIENQVGKLLMYIVAKGGHPN
jgi:hypothetical protein